MDEERSRPAPSDVRPAPSSLPQAHALPPIPAVACWPRSPGVEALLWSCHCSTRLHFSYIPFFPTPLPGSVGVVLHHHVHPRPPPPRSEMLIAGLILGATCFSLLLSPFDKPFSQLYPVPS